MLYNETLNTISSNESFSDCVSCTTYTVLFAVFLITSVIIGSVFDYFYRHSKKEDDNSRVMYNLGTTQTLKY